MHPFERLFRISGSPSNLVCPPPMKLEFSVFYTLYICTSSFSKMSLLGIVQVSDEISLVTLFNELQIKFTE